MYQNLLLQVLGTVGLGVCYAIARSLGHVGVFCDISDLVKDLPERILFRLNFGLVGAFLAILSVPIHDMTMARVGGFLPKLAAAFQFISGIGVILVGACGPTEIEWFHLVAAAMGFAGSGIAQILYNFVFYWEDEVTQPDSAKTIFKWRIATSTGFVICAIIFGLGEADVFPEPTEHICEWGLWFFLLGWYFTFRWDLKDFYLSSEDTVKSSGTRSYVPVAKYYAPRSNGAIVQGVAVY